MNLYISLSKELHTVLDGVGNTDAIWLILLNKNAFTTIILPNMVKCLKIQVLVNLQISSRHFSKLTPMFQGYYQIGTITVWTQYTISAVAYLQELVLFGCLQKLLPVFYYHLPSDLTTSQMFWDTEVGFWLFLCFFSAGHIFCILSKQWDHWIGLEHLSLSYKPEIILSNKEYQQFNAEDEEVASNWIALPNTLEDR